MPDYLPPRVGVQYSEAHAEAATYANVRDVTLETIALYHPNFLDENGVPGAEFYFVNEYQNFIATLEDSAPRGAGTTVEFIRCPISTKLPNEQEQNMGNPEFNLNFSGVSGDIALQLDKAVLSDIPIEMTVRTYISTDPSGPSILPPLRMTVTSVSINEDVVTATATYPDPLRRGFPGMFYTRREYPTLSGR